MLQHDFIVLDRSGSMAGSIWMESLNSINAYVAKLAADNVDTGVTIAVFDTNGPFEIIRNRVTPKTFKPLLHREQIGESTGNLLEPRGGTPLNDATMRLLDTAEAGAPWGEKYEKAAIVIVTDGGENASQEFGTGTGGTAKVKNRLDAVRSKGWQVVYLGANFDNQAQAMSYGATRGSTVSATVGNMVDTMNLMATKRGMYGTGAAATMDWSETEKTEVAQKKKETAKNTTI